MNIDVKLIHRETIKYIKFRYILDRYTFETKDTRLVFNSIRKITFNKNKEYQLKIYFYRDIYNDIALIEYKFKPITQEKKDRRICFNKKILTLYYHFYATSSVIYEK